MGLQACIPIANLRLRHIITSFQNLTSNMHIQYTTLCQWCMPCMGFKHRWYKTKFKISFWQQKSWWDNQIYRCLLYGCSFYNPTCHDSNPPNLCKYSSLFALNFKSYLKVSHKTELRRNTWELMIAGFYFPSCHFKFIVRCLLQIHDCTHESWACCSWTSSWYTTLSTYFILQG
jgi:hypothetical protein